MPRQSPSRPHPVPVRMAPTISGLPVLEVDGHLFRDLDHDGVLAPYEDWRLPAAARARDLLARMTLAEKVGTMLHGSAPARGDLGGIGVGAEYDPDGLDELIRHRHITSLISRLSTPPTDFAVQNNSVQVLASGSRLGIPVTLSTDPRHHFAGVLGASTSAQGFSQWPETLGLAAIADPEVMREFGDVVRREYQAVGLHMFLGPQADLATSQRWPRIEGTFGEDPALVNKLVEAMIEGLQQGRDGLHPGSVAAVVKHWVGYGASRDGFDGHNWYGRYSAFPSGALADHLDAFTGALSVKVAGVMPTYNILQDVRVDGRPLEPVGAGFNAQLIDGLLRGGYGYRGTVLSDWAITRDLTESARTGVPEQSPAQIAMPWGVEDLTRVERFARCINAGVDQIGGEDDPAPLVDAVEQGLVAPARIDAACLRILMDKFRLGLFDAPLVSVDAVPGEVARPADLARARAAEHASLTWITHPSNDGPVPLPAGTTVYLDGVAATEAESRGLRVTTDPREAAVAVTRTSTPHEPLHPGHFFGRIQHEGKLDFTPGEPETERLLALCRAVPTVIVVHLDRPAVLGELATAAAGLIGEFGASDAAVLDVLTGQAAATGRLPFRLHATMQDALDQPCDRPRAELPGRFPLGHRAEP